MKKIFSLFAAVLMAGSMVATDYQKVTTAPADWSGEYVIAATASDGKALVWTGVDAGKCRDSVVVTDGKISGDNFVTVTVEAMAEGYSIKVNGGANDGKYISSGTSAPTYSNGLKFIETATRVDFAFNTDSTVAMSQTISGNADEKKNGTVYLIYNKSTGDNNERYRFYKGTNYNTPGYLTPCLYKKVEAPVINYWLVGTAAENGWNAATAMPMAGDSIVRSLAAGTYEFKVLVAKGSWDGALGFGNVNADCSSEGYEDNGGNVKVTLNEAGDLKVKVVGGQICVTGAFGQAVVTVYTIVGEAALMGVKWDQTAVANDMTENEGVWTLVKTGVELTAKNYEYKVVGNHAWGVADFPTQGNNTLTIAEAGTYDVTFTWNPAENSLTATAVKDAPAVNPWCEKEIGHFAAESADPNSFVLLTITAIEGGKTRVTVAQDATKNTKTFDYLQVTGLASVGADVEDGGKTELSVEFTTPTPDANGEITLEILWSNPGWPGRWMVQNIKAKATDACEVTIPTAVDNIEAGKVVKTIENGQVVIIRDGIRYNAAGLKL